MVKSSWPLAWLAMLGPETSVRSTMPGTQDYGETNMLKFSRDNFCYFHFVRERSRQLWSNDNSVLRSLIATSITNKQTQRSYFQDFREIQLHARFENFPHYQIQYNILMICGCILQLASSVQITDQTFECLRIIMQDFAYINCQLCMQPASYTASTQARDP